MLECLLIYGLSRERYETFVFSGLRCCLLLLRISGSLDARKKIKCGRAVRRQVEC